MNLSKALIIAKREYLTTVRRKAFVFTLLLTPTIFFIAGVVSARLRRSPPRRPSTCRSSCACIPTRRPHSIRSTPVM